ncbi:MAG: tetratricopeptide repeat protein [Candidatus Schekmanbacteria bacterium]|nr:tetratricopeptide repeat protein [Candidatus Schekmanbacteria bacterium]
MDFPIQDILIVLPVFTFGSGFILAWILKKRHKPASNAALSQENRAYIKGLNYIIANMPDKAIAEFTKAVQLNSDTVEIYLSLGNLFREKGDVERAIRIHQSILLRPTLDPKTHVQALVDLGLDYHKAGFIDRAIETYKKVIGLDPNSLIAYKQLEKLHEEENNWERAYSIQHKIMRLENSKDQRMLAHIQVQMGQQFYEAGDPRQAFKRLKTAMMLNKGCTPAYLLMGDIYFDEGKLDKAIAIWEEIVDNGLRFAFLAYRRLENAYLQQGQYDKIGHLYRRMLKDKPGDIRTRIALAKYYHKSGRSDQAIGELQEALKHNSKVPEVRQYLLQILLETKGADVISQYTNLFQELKTEDIPLHCSHCGYEDLELPWKCLRCREWDTFIDYLSGEQPAKS